MIYPSEQPYMLRWREVFKYKLWIHQSWMEWLVLRWVNCNIGYRFLLTYCCSHQICIRSVYIFPCMLLHRAYRDVLYHAPLPPLDNNGYKMNYNNTKQSSSYCHLALTILAMACRHWNLYDSVGRESGHFYFQRDVEFFLGPLMSVPGSMLAPRLSTSV